MLYGTQNPHGGDVYGAGIRLDFSSNINPLGAPPGVYEALTAAAELARQYPDPYCRALTAAIAAHEAVPAAYVLCGAGAAELIYAYCDALRPARAAVLSPSFLEYAAAAAHFGAQRINLPLRAPDFTPDASLLPRIAQERPDALFLCTPNNPTGRTIPCALLEDILALCETQGTRVLLDECFLDFTEQASAKDLLSRYRDLLILKAFTKNYALAGVRAGYCLTADAGLLAKMAAASQPWNVSVFAQAAGAAALQTPGWMARTRAWLAPERAFLSDGLRACGFSVCPSEANYVLFSGPEGLARALLRLGIAIRDCANYPGLGPGWYRVAVRLRAENEALLDAMRRVTEEETWR